MEQRETRMHDNPAADAAGLLLRIGFGLLVLAAPVAAIYSRRAFVVLVPIGSLLIGLAALINDAPRLVREVREAVLSPIGALLTLLLVWLVMSLFWTPFPAAAAERAFRTLGNVLLALFVALALPERMRASNLHLMSIGVAAATLLLALSALLGPYTFRALLNPEAPTFSRAALAVSVMVWPAVAWTYIRHRDWQGLALIAVSALAIAASGSLEAMITLITALLIFLGARLWPILTGNLLSLLFGLTILLAPLLAFAARWLAGLMGLSSGSFLAEAGLWADEIALEPIRLLTGHGFDTSHRASLAGLVSPTAPDGLLQVLWFDLGLPGAALMALTVTLGFRALSILPQPLAPTSMAVLAACLIFSFLDPTAMQAWWLSVSVVASVMLVAVANGQYRTARPMASLAGSPPVLPGLPRRPAAH